MSDEPRLITITNSQGTTTRPMLPHEIEEWDRFGRALAAHETEETRTSGAIIAAVRRALPSWSVDWVMTGGGCSGWQITPRDGHEDDPSILITGLDDTTEASGDLTLGSVIGAYDFEGSPLGDEQDYYAETRSADPFVVAQHVSAYVARTLRLYPLLGA